MNSPQHSPKILAIKLRAIGDTVIWTAALQQLRESFPESEIHTLTYASNEAVLRHHPAVHAAHFLHSRSHVELLRMLLKLRRQKFAWALGFHATTSLCRWAWLSRAEKRALHHHSWSYTPRGSVPVPQAGQLEDAITRDRRVLESMGISAKAPPTRLCLTADEETTAEQKVRTAIRKCGGNVEQPRYVFLPGGGHPLRRYPKDLWLPLLEQVKRQGNYQPVVIVDQLVSEEWNLRAECERLSVPLFDRGELREFICLVSRGSRALANDSGPGHIAVALGLRTSFVFGPGCVGDWHCYDREEHPLFRVEVPCRLQGPRDREAFQFCTVNTCAHHSCMRGNQFKIDKDQTSSSKKIHAGQQRMPSPLTKST